MVRSVVDNENNIIGKATITTQEMMAIAVLQGDTLAAKALADVILENHKETLTELPPISRITCDRDRLRVIIYTSEPTSAIDVQYINRSVNYWLNGSAEEPLLLTGVDRIEMYELPENWQPSNLTSEARTIGSLSENFDDPSDGL